MNIKWRRAWVAQILEPFPDWWLRLVLFLPSPQTSLPPWGLPLHKDRKTTHATPVLKKSSMLSAFSPEWSTSRMHSTHTCLGLLRDAGWWLVECRAFPPTSLDVVVCCVGRYLSWERPEHRLLCYKVLFILFIFDIQNSYSFVILILAILFLMYMKLHNWY